LLDRIRNRRIGIELCPSSNDQIVGFRDSFSNIESDRLSEYPLKRFLESGIRVSINTDDGAMSRTDLTYEFYKAACLVPGGLSRWEILQLIRNGFQSAFLDPLERKELILKAERMILQTINH